MLPKQSRSAQSASPPLRDLGSALVSGNRSTSYYKNYARQEFIRARWIVISLTLGVCLNHELSLVT